MKKKKTKLQEVSFTLNKNFEKFCLEKGHWGLLFDFFTQPEWTSEMELQLACNTS